MNPEISTPTTPEQAPIETLPSTPFWKNKFFLGFVGISFLAAFIIGGIAIGKDQANKQSSTPTPTPAPTRAADDTANWKTFPASVDMTNWKTYKSKTEGFSLKYPPDWKFESSLPVSGGIKESLTLSSPNNFIFQYYTQVAPFDGGCDDCKIGDVEKLTFSNHEPLYFAQETMAGIPSIVLTEKEVKKGESDWAYPYLKSKFIVNEDSKINGARSGYSINGSYKQPKDFPYHINKVDPKEFADREDVITAITILRSLSF